MSNSIVPYDIFIDLLDYNNEELDNVMTVRLGRNIPSLAAIVMSDNDRRIVSDTVFRVEYEDDDDERVIAIGWWNSEKLLRSLTIVHVSLFSRLNLQYETRLVDDYTGSIDRDLQVGYHGVEILDRVLFRKLINSQIRVHAIGYYDDKFRLHFLNEHYVDLCKQYAIPYSLPPTTETAPNQLIEVKSEECDKTFVAFLGFAHHYTFSDFLFRPTSEIVKVYGQIEWGSIDTGCTRLRIPYSATLYKLQYMGIQYPLQYDDININLIVGYGGITGLSTTRFKQFGNRVKAIFYVDEFADKRQLSPAIRGLCEKLGICVDSLQTITADNVLYYSSKKLQLYTLAELHGLDYLRQMCANAHIEISGDIFDIVNRLVSWEIERGAKLHTRITFTHNDNEVQLISPC